MAKDSGIKTWQWVLMVGGAFVGGALIFGGKKGNGTPAPTNVALPPQNAFIPQAVVNAPVNAGAPRAPDPTAHAADPGATSELQSYTMMAAQSCQNKVAALEAELSQVLATEVRVPAWEGVSAKMVDVMNGVKEAVSKVEEFKAKAADPSAIKGLEDLVTAMMAFGAHVRESIMGRFGDVEGGTHVPMWARNAPAT